MIKKVLAFCIRKKMNKHEILVLSKVNGKGIEVPGGSVEENESFENAVKRELFEETGINSIRNMSKVLTVPFYADWRKEWQERNIFKLELENTSKDEWEHIISDGKEDKGKKARIFWLDVDLAKKELLWGQGQFIEDILNI
jgi:ADP-ribose pyrophosphatase